MVSSRKWWAVATLLFVSASVTTSAARESMPHASFAQVTDRTSVPYGWVDFCSRYAGECDGPALPAADVTLSTKAFKEIDRVNRTVNQSVRPETDMDHWGVVDRWDYPLDGRGDCEDYALLKRKLLMDEGYPRQALLITVVKDRAGEGHAVLTIKTDRGEFVLDNMVDVVMAWDATGYRFVKRQSQEDPNVWRSIGPAVAAPLFTAR